LPPCNFSVASPHNNKNGRERIVSGNKKIAWVTGGGTVIGKAGAEALLADGWSVIISGRRPEMRRR
jgi:hypothetical protein